MATTQTEFAVNERVSHSVYGFRTISMVDDAHTVIQFDEHGRRKFATSMMRLEHSDVAAPVRKRSKPKKAKSSK